MAKQNTFPHVDINIRDVPVPQPVIQTPLPLHVPVFFIYAAQGPLGIPVLGTYSQHAVTFGDYTFDERGPFHQHPTVFAKRACQYQQVYLVRLADTTATTGSLGLFCTVTPTALVQYQRDVYGNYVVDSSNNPVPMLLADGITIKTEPGMSLDWSVRQLADGETFDTLQEVTTLVGGVDVVTFPVFAVSAVSPGSAINNVGYRMYYSTDFDQNVVDNIDAMTYQFEPVQKDSTTAIVSPIYDIYNDSTNAVALKANAYNVDTAQYLDLAEIVQQQYTTGLPYELFVYTDYVAAIGSAVLSVSPELDGTSPYRINIMTAVDDAQHPYSHVVVTKASASILNPNVVLYLVGGSDGTLTKSNLEDLTIAYVAGDVYPMLNNPYRYPITHMYDSGYSLPNKLNLLKIWNIRDDIKIDFSTQDVANRANTAAEDQSTGSALRSAILLHPESLVFGTEAIRASVYQQCSTLTDTQTYRNIVPATIDRMIKRCMYNGVDYVTDTPKGRPNSEVSILSATNINWSPTTTDQKQLSWDTGLNYIDYCDIDTLFYADLRSIYPIDTSLLSDDVFVDMLVYLKHIARNIWTFYAGRSDRAAVLFPRIEDDIDKRCSYAFNGGVKTSTKVYQTDIDSALGYQSTVEITVYGTMPNRVWKVIVPVTRTASV